MTCNRRENPLFSACGLHCELCPRHYTQGASRCPGCAGAGFSQVHPSCGVLSCCQRHGLEYCVQCAEYPCKKYDGADQSDSFISHKNQLSDFETARGIGLDAYEAQMAQKHTLLQRLLQDYDDGRRKSFFCLAVNLLPLADIQTIVVQLEREFTPGGPTAQRAARAASLLLETADAQDITLKLRKK